MKVFNTVYIFLYVHYRYSYNCPMLLWVWYKHGTIVRRTAVQAEQFSANIVNTTLKILFTTMLHEMVSDFFPYGMSCRIYVNIRWKANLAIQTLEQRIMQNMHDFPARFTWHLMKHLRDKNVDVTWMTVYKNCVAISF